MNVMLPKKAAKSIGKFYLDDSNSNFTSSLGQEEVISDIEMQL